MVAARRYRAPVCVAHGAAVSALVTAAEAQSLLDDYATGFMPDGPERSELARAVVAQADANDRLLAVIGDAAASLDGEHMVTCARWVSVRALCDCIVGRVRATLAKAVQR